MLPRMYLMPTSAKARQAVRRQMREEREKRLERITRNLIEYEFIREQARLNKRSEAVLDRMRNDSLRTEKRIEQTLNIHNRETTKVQEQALALLNLGDDELIDNADDDE